MRTGLFDALSILAILRFTIATRIGRGEDQEMAEREWERERMAKRRVSFGAKRGGHRAMAMMTLQPTGKLAKARANSA